MSKMHDKKDVDPYWNASAYDAMQDLVHDRLGPALQEKGCRTVKGS